MIQNQGISFIRKHPIYRDEETDGQAEAEVIRKRADVLALDYSRTEIAVDSRYVLMSCTQVQRMSHIEEDAARSVRPKGERC